MVMSLLEWALIVGVVLLTPRIVGSRGLQILLAELVLVPFMTGDATTDRPEHPMTRHVARQSTCRGTRQAPEGVRRMRVCRTEQKQHRGGENRSSHGLAPSLRQWLLFIFGRVAAAHEAKHLAAVGQRVIVFLNLRRSVFRRRLRSDRPEDEFAGGIGSFG